MPADITPLLRRLQQMESRIATLERNQRANNIANATIENGALTVNDGNGNPVISLGLQPDGTYAHVATPATSPEAPDAPVLTATSLGLQVTWDGDMTDGSTPLSDFDYVQVHVSQAAGFTPSAATMAGVLHEAGSLMVTGLPASTTYYCCLVAINVGDNTSEQGPYASAITSPVGGQHVAANAFGLNMIPDPGFTSAQLCLARSSPPTTGAWTVGSGAAAVTVGTHTQILYLTTQDALWLNAGEQYYVQATVTVSGACTVGIGIENTGVTASADQQFVFSGAGTQTIAGTVTIPSGFGPTGFVRVFTIGQVSGTPSASFSAPVCQPASFFSPTIMGTNWVANPLGEFYYSGPPALGNLILSNAPAGGTDSEGNTYLQGLTTYSNVGSRYYAIQQFASGGAGSITLWTATSAGGTYASVGGLDFSGTSSANAVFQVFFALNCVSGSPANQTVILTDNWNAATLAGSWSSSGGETLRYSLMNDGTVQVTGELTVPSSPGNPSTVTTLPSAYFPQRTEFLVAIENAGTPFTGIAHVCQISTTGVIQVYGTLTAGNTLRLFGRYPLTTT